MDAFIAEYFHSARNGALGSVRETDPPLSLSLSLSLSRAKRYTVPLSEKRNVRRAAMQLHVCRCILDA